MFSATTSLWRPLRIQPLRQAGIIIIHFPSLTRRQPKTPLSGERALNVSSCLALRTQLVDVRRQAARGEVTRNTILISGNLKNNTQLYWRDYTTRELTKAILTKGTISKQHLLWGSAIAMGSGDSLTSVTYLRGSYNKGSDWCGVP